MTGSFQFQTYCGDLLRQNAATIVHLDLMPRARPRTILFPFDALYPLAGNQTTSNLSLLKIGGMVLTRDGFSSLLRTCPALKALHLERSIIYTSSCSDPYQHTGLTELVAPLEQIYGADPVTTLAPWILEHFPQLEVLYTWTMKPTMEVTASEMKAQFTRCCPHLKGIGIDSTALITSELLTAVFHSLTTIVVSNFSISTGVMDAILSHQGTLIRFSTSLQSIEYYDQEDTAEYGDGVLVSGEIIQLIPATCARLTKLELPSWVMDMTEIEEAKWSCTELEELYVRVRELDTKEKIDCAIGMWIGYRNSKNTKGRGDPGSSVDQSSDCHENSTAETAREEEPIEARVARHLSCFGKLRKVWLGPKTQLVRV
ncbi:hypothetical protein BGX31_010525 [Mortierella sp. GBA43]|nr:hypothetical protein BGX31_010525 [Mortierella sp. GBA43]